MKPQGTWQTVRAFLMTAAIVIVPSGAFADARKAEEEPSSGGIIRTLPCNFGDETYAVTVPPTPGMDKRIVKLKSRYFIPDKRTPIRLSGFTDRIYVQFNRTLTQRDLRKLKSVGATVEDYVTNNTFVVEVSEEAVAALRKLPFVAGLEEIDWRDKMSESLYRGRIGSWASRPAGGVALRLAIRAGEPRERRKATLAARGMSVESEDLAFKQTVAGVAPLASVRLLAQEGFVRWIEVQPPPYKDCNVYGGILSNVYMYSPGQPENLLAVTDATGAGINIAIVDGDAVFQHSAFDERLTIAEQGHSGSPVSPHATHVAGTIGGDLLEYDSGEGTWVKAMGVAPGCNLFSYSYYTKPDGVMLDFADAVANNASAAVNCSFGRVIGWHRFGPGPQDWVWFGDPEHPQDLPFGEYAIGSAQWDQFVYAYYDWCPVLVKAAGNDRNDTGPDGGPYPRDGTLHPGNGEYYDLIDWEGVAKNILTVGAVLWDDLDQGDGGPGNENKTVDSGEVGMAYYSSFGPADDGRLKPELVAQGTLLSTWCLKYDDIWHEAWDTKEGTSMSAPIVTGVVALLQEVHSRTANYGTSAPPDVVKAVLCNAAQGCTIGGPGPDYQSGFGIVNAAEALKTVDGTLHYGYSPPGGYIATGVLEEEGDVLEYELIMQGTYFSPVKVTLAWVDPPGDPSAQGALVNDLDLTVENPTGQTYYPYVLNPDDPDAQATTGVNSVDNVEQVRADSSAGGTWKVRVAATALPRPGQRFALASNLGFKGLLFLDCKVGVGNQHWADATKTMASGKLNPALRAAVYGRTKEMNVVTGEYSWSDDGGETWSDWEPVSGAYSDPACETAIQSQNYTGTAYLKVDEGGTDFRAFSFADNRVRFRIQDASQPPEWFVSRAYTIRTTCGCYVAPHGDDLLGDGTPQNPYASITKALREVSGVPSAHALIRVQEGTYYESIVMKPCADISGGYDAAWRTPSPQATVVIGDGLNPTVVGADDAVLERLTLLSWKYWGEDVQRWRHGYGQVACRNTSPVIQDCVISFGRDAIREFGGAILCAGTGCEAKMRRCVIVNNWSHYGGGGIACTEGACPVIESSILCGNEVVMGPGSAIYFDSNAGSLPTIVNCTIVGNRNRLCVEGAAAIGGPLFDPGQGLPIRNCILWGNLNGAAPGGPNPDMWALPAEYCDIEHPVLPGYENISDNPQFVSDGHWDDRGTPDSMVDDIWVDGDLHLAPASPCADAANNGALSAEHTSDIDGDARVLAWSTAETVDMGADEYKWPSPVATRNPDGSISLTWESDAGRSYSVEWAAGLGSGFGWCEILYGPGQEGTSTWTDNGQQTGSHPSTVSARFYRVRYSLP
jgi:hypothetical protein